MCLKPKLGHWSFEIKTTISLLSPLCFSRNQCLIINNYGVRHISNTGLEPRNQYYSQETCAGRLSAGKWGCVLEIQATWRENSWTQRIPARRHLLQSWASVERHCRPWPSSSGARLVCSLNQSGIFGKDPSVKRKPQIQDTTKQFLRTNPALCSICGKANSN